MIPSERPPVWPWHDGDTRGGGSKPLYKDVPHAALRDPALHQLLALVDAIRDGRAREPNLAERDSLHKLNSIHGQPNLQLLADAAKLLRPSETAKPSARDFLGK